MYERWKCVWPKQAGYSFLKIICIEFCGTAQWADCVMEVHLASWTNAQTISGSGPWLLLPASAAVAPSALVLEDHESLRLGASTSWRGYVHKWQSTTDGEREREMSKQHTVRAEKSGGVEQSERNAQRRENREYKVSIGKSLCILRYFCIWWTKGSEEKARKRGNHQGRLLVM